MDMVAFWVAILGVLVATIGLLVYSALLILRRTSPPLWWKLFIGVAALAILMWTVGVIFGSLGMDIHWRWHNGQ